MLLTDEVITTDRLILKNLTPEDVNGKYALWVKDSEITRFLELRHLTLDKTALVNFVNSMNESEDNLMLGIFLSENDRHIGNIKLGPVDKRNNRGVIGLMIGERDCWGQGYATEAIQGLTEYAFGVMGLNRIGAGAYASNIGSCRAFEKAGYHIEGRLLSYWKSGNGYEDEILVGIVRNQ